MPDSRFHEIAYLGSGLFCHVYKPDWNLVPHYSAGKFGVFSFTHSLLFISISKNKIAISDSHPKIPEVISLRCDLSTDILKYSPGISYVESSL